MKQMRKIIEINEEECDGCGLCIVGCHENALAIVDGKARLVKESCCDGLGDCVGECPRGALRVGEREAEPFEERRGEEKTAPPPLGFACPGTRAGSIDAAVQATPVSTEEVGPELRQWPVQLRLVPVDAPFWNECDLLVAADCTPVAYGNFQRDFLRGRRVVIACPKLDETGEYRGKLAEIFRRNRVRTVTVLRMEVPCCGGIDRLVRAAAADAGTGIEVGTVTVTLDGRLLNA